MINSFNELFFKYFIISIIWLIIACENISLISLLIVFPSNVCFLFLLIISCACLLLNATNIINMLIQKEPKWIFQFLETTFLSDLLFWVYITLSHTYFFAIFYSKRKSYKNNCNINSRFYFHFTISTLP